MPEKDQTPATETAAPVDPAMPKDGGSVMISMPEEAFTAMHQIVTQLAAGMDQLAQSVLGQKEMPVEPSAPEEAAAVGTDEEFLNNIAQEGSLR